MQAALYVLGALMILGALINVGIWIRVRRYGVSQVVRSPRAVVVRLWLFGVVSGVAVIAGGGATALWPVAAGVAAVLIVWELAVQVTALSRRRRRASRAS